MYSWPGNIRELKNVLERAYIVAGDSITPSDLRIPVTRRDFLQSVEGGMSSVKLRDIERAHILHILEMNDGHMSRTAEDLDINRRTLRNKIARYREQGFLK